MSAPSNYILGQSSRAELRLQILDELSGAQFVTAMHALPKQNVRILVIGCGSGYLEARLSTVFAESHFVGIDISPDRIRECRERTNSLKSSNTFEFVEGDIATVSTNELKPFDILISRFVLSHLPNALQLFGRLLPFVKPGGYVCLQEIASNGQEYYCNSVQSGYTFWVELLNEQIRAQRCSFETGFALLAQLKQHQWKILNQEISQQTLCREREKSILRLGVEDAGQTLLKKIGQQKLDDVIASLKQFEKNTLAFGLYTRSIIVVAQSKSS